MSLIFPENGSEVSEETCSEDMSPLFFEMPLFDPFNMEEDKEKPKREKVDISVLAPHVRKHVEVLLDQPIIGLCHREVEVLNPKPSFPSYEKENSNCDRFQIVIPYAGMRIECMVVFQSSGPECPPDFVFSDSRFFVPIDQIETLCSWDVHKSDGLLKVMKEIMQFYKKKQIQELDRYEHLSFEYLCLFQLQNFNEDDIEILVPSDPETPVLFLIRLPADFRHILPDFYQEESDLRDFPLLLVSFPNRDSSRSCQRLYLTKKTQLLLGMDESFQLPDEVNDNYLTRYIIALEDELKTKAEMAASRYERRRMYFTQFLSHFYRCVVEYDVLYFSSMTLILREDDFHFILEINLPDDFPMGTPALVFRSIYHSFMGDPVAVAVDNYPYSPTWSMQKILDETVKFIEEYVHLFRQDDGSYC
ncbi:unnamed protein product [Larinioides sclopetarius]|uniref:BRISC and BRCA1-A complex member 2 n=2 Tax=Larinioides sclopetarius TaxID=280406 RepID=A0AAV1Z1I3_9ARAC